MSASPDLLTRPVLGGPVLRGGVWRLWPALIPALLFAPVVWSPPLNHDVAAILDFSQRWLAGERLYVDLIDVNPPLIFVLNLIPAAIARMTPLGAVVALELCLLGWGLLAWWLSVAVRDRAAEGRAERAFLDVLPALFLFAGGYDYGQREHLMAVAALPYLLAAARRSEGARPRHGLAAAVFAAVGFALKPYFLGVPALVELLVLLRRGWRRRDGVPWTMAAVWVAYAASLPLLFPAYLGAVVPMVMSNYLDISDHTALGVLLVSRMAAILALLVPMLCVAFMQANAFPRTLAAAAAGALASAVAQHKGWSYQIVPIEHFTLAMALVLAAQWLDASGAIRSAKTAVRAAAVFGGMFGLYVISNSEAPWKELDYGHDLVSGLSAILQRVAPGAPVLVMSPGIYPIYPAVNYAGSRMTLRTMNMWMLEGAYQTCLPDGRRYRAPGEMGEAEAMVFRDVSAAFAAHPPAAVVVDKQPGIPWCGSEFDFLAYFERNPVFAAAFSHYRLDTEWDRYLVYVRP
ncbi:MAG TPA: hypothetical protein VHS58_20810 [Acetobacteraceae bacterium]|jgi:hypothetical protein|nr:hypothetical protein [Acetobacteraceae bacterium]